MKRSVSLLLVLDHFFSAIFHLKFVHLHKMLENLRPEISF